MSANASGTNEREAFLMWCNTQIFPKSWEDDEGAFVAWQARGELEAKKLEGYQARVRELEEALQAALTQMEEDIITIDGEWGSCRSLEELESDGELWSEIVQARKMLSTTTPDTALQKALLEARIDEHDMPANGTRIAQLRAQLASLNETLGE